MAAVPTDPRVIHTRQVVHDAVLRELADRGYGGLTVEGVAARAGIAKSTLYRHWPDGAALIADTLASRPPQPLTTPADGSARDRIVQLLIHLAQAMADPQTSATLPAMIEAAEHDPAVAAFHHAESERRRQQLIDLVALGVQEGELAPDLDPDLTALALCGPIVYRRTMTARPFVLADVGRLAGLVLGEPGPAG